jgi:GNAT superfamily N-acetyltransferase
MFEIKRAGLDGVKLLLDWAATEGWNPGINDASAFHAADPQGFLMGHLDGKPVTGISVVAADDTFGFLGLYIVHPDHRGQGHGLQTWQAGLAYLGTRTIGLDGVVAQQANYERSGFQRAHRSLRYVGQSTHDAKFAPLLTPHDFDELLPYDAACYGAERVGFLKHWFDGSDGRKCLKVKRNDQLAGYGVIRPCRTGYKIGPLFADTPALAETLIVSLMSNTNGEAITIDMPEPNSEGLKMLASLGFAPVFETARMYKGKALDLPLKKIFGITSFELG